MKLVDYVSGASEKVKDFGSGVYDVVSKAGPKAVVRTGLVGLLLLPGCLSPYGKGVLSPYGKGVARNLALTGAKQMIMSGVQNEIEGPRGTTVNVGNGRNLSRSDAMLLNGIKNMPRVVCLGDVDGDGKIDWTYFDGKGNAYNAVKLFKNDSGKIRYGKRGDFNQDAGFEYHDLDRGLAPKVPSNALVIWYANPALGID